MSILLISARIPCYSRFFLLNCTCRKYSACKDMDLHADFICCFYFAEILSQGVYMNTKNRKKPSGSTGSGQRILYDARGARVKRSPLSNRFVRFLLFGLLPYVVINGIILLLVCSTPRIAIQVKDTNDYMSTQVDFTVRSLLPLKELNVTMESVPLEYTKSGQTYHTTVTQNGTFFVEATSINKMYRSAYADVTMLDDTPPSVNEESAAIDNNTLTFTVSDSQSGVNYDSIVGIVNGTETIYPSHVDRNMGLIKMDLPNRTETVELHFEDMVGNARSGRITVNTQLIDPNAEESE